MQATTERIFWGTLSGELADFRLETPEGGMLLVFFDGELKRFVNEHKLEHHRRVSIFGYEGRDDRGKVVAVLNPTSVVSHHIIAVRAYEIFESGRGASALDNWLTAERRLLECLPV